MESTNVPNAIIGGILVSLSYSIYQYTHSQPLRLSDIFWSLTILQVSRSSITRVPSSIPPSNFRHLLHFRSSFWLSWLWRSGKFQSLRFKRWYFDSNFNVRICFGRIYHRNRSSIIQRRLSLSFSDRVPQRSIRISCNNDSNVRFSIFFLLACFRKSFNFSI